MISQVSSSVPAASGAGMNVTIEVRPSGRSRDQRSKAASALRQRGLEAPGTWSRDARAWAEREALVTGDTDQERRYRALATREETVQMLYRLFLNGNEP